MATRFASAALLATASLLVNTAPAGAATTIGQLAAAPAPTCVTQTDWLNPTVPNGTSYVVPALAGTSAERITSWSTNATSGAGQTLAMKVFRQVSGLTWMVVGHDGPRVLTQSTLNTFSGINIAVKPGDVLGINSANAAAANNACKFFVGGGEPYLLKSGDLPDGGSEMFSTDNGYRMNVTAVVQPSNAFTFGDTKDKRNGTALIVVNAPGSGVFELSGQSLFSASGAGTRSSVTATGPGIVKLLVKAKGKAKKKLKKTGKAKVTANVTFTPTGGDPSTKSETVKLKKKR
jgi:hypothetical protein